MSRRALRLAPRDPDVQVTHAMLLLDAGDEDELFALLPDLAPAVRATVAVRMADHVRFGEAVELALVDHGALDTDLFAELGEAVLAHAPARLGRLVPLLPEDIDLLGVLAYKAIRAGQHDHAIALYDRLLALPIPEAGHERGTYLRALNNACVQAHAAQAFDAAVRIANRAQPVAHENPYIYHAAACAYAAVGDYAKAFEQVKLAVEHDYDHLVKVETDRDLGQLLDWPEFKALFRDWHARLEGN
jgi:tetratricopeptide (TPR) repeat protein